MELAHALLAYLLLTANGILLFFGVEQCAPSQHPRCHAPVRTVSPVRRCTEAQTLIAAITSSACSSVACLIGRMLFQSGLNVGGRKRTLDANVNDRLHSFVAQLPSLRMARPATGDATLANAGGVWLGEASLSERSGGGKGSTKEVSAQQREWMSKQRGQQGQSTAASEESSKGRRRNAYARQRRRGLEHGQESRTTLGAGEAAWLLLYPSQVAEEEDGPGVGFYHPPGEEGGVHTSFELSGAGAASDVADTAGTLSSQQQARC